MPFVVPYLAVFISGLCVMVVELVAGRMIAKHLGASIYTWTSVIGIILAGIASGNYLGGRIADRFPPRPALSLLFLCSSFVTVSIPLASRWVGEWIFLWTLEWPLRVSLHVAAIFLLPSLLLGTVSPVAAKAAIADARRTGRALGSIYAWGVLGSILGTFLTGFYLIPSFGTDTVIWVVVAVLAIMGVVVGGRPRIAAPWLIVLSALGVVQWAPWAWAETAGRFMQLRRPVPERMVAEVESLYSHIRVLSSSKDGVERRHLMLDKMVHNTLVLDEPRALQDPYIRLFAALTRHLTPAPAPLATLTIGGGGYIFPRYTLLDWPGSRVDVVEIDSSVTRIAADVLRISLEGMTIHHEDGRVFVRRLAREGRGEGRGRYDFVYLDAFNDYSVPHQLTTREFTEDVRELLAPDGAFLINLIDSYHSGKLLGAMLNTLEEVFAEVSVFIEGSPRALGPGNTFVVCATNGRRDYTGLVERDPEAFGVHRLSPDDLVELRRRSDGIVLTDRWAPTENLLAPVVRASSKMLAAGALVSQGVGFLNRADLPAAESAFLRAIEIDPGKHDAHRYLGFIHEKRGDWERSQAHYERSLRLRPDQMDLYVELALAAEGRDDPAGAEAYLRRALTVYAADVELSLNLGIILAKQRRWPEAIGEFRRVVAAAPDHFDGRLSLARALLAVGETAGARVQLEAARRIDPSHPAVQSLWKKSAHDR